MPKCGVRLYKTDGDAIRADCVFSPGQIRVVVEALGVYLNSRPQHRRNREVAMHLWKKLAPATWGDTGEFKKGDGEISGIPEHR